MRRLGGIEIATPLAIACPSASWAVALGAFYRRLACRVGKAKAITAIARKLAILVYRTLKDGLVS